MTLFSRRPALRWLLPLLAAGVLITAGSIVSTITASARDSLPERSAAQLLVDVQNARVEGLSGTVVQTSALGLPELPGVAGGDSAEFSSLVSGSHTMRVWYAGPDRLRLALLGQFGESDLVRDGSDVWAWSSQQNTATHLTLPAGEHADAGSTPGAAGAITPQQAADQALKAIEPTTRVSTDPTAVVAGRTAYQLVLEPRDTGSLVGSVRIAIDGATHIPTRVQVLPKGSSSPAFEVGFTSFDPSAPSDSVFGFNPPPGAKVEEKSAEDWMAGHDKAGSGQGSDGGSDGTAKPRVVGSGWTSVLVATLPQAGDSATSGSGTNGSGGQLAGILKSLPTVSGDWGSGHLLQGTLFSAVLTDDGRVAVGAVPPATLYDALSAS